MNWIADWFLIQWDLTGVQCSKTLVCPDEHQFHAALLVFDVCDAESFDDIQIKHLRDSNFYCMERPLAPVQILIGIKRSDQNISRAIQFEQAQKFAKENNLN